MAVFAVIDTETNWNNQVMSLGVVLGDSRDLHLLDGRYYVFPRECQVGGMYDGVLDLVPGEQTRVLSRTQAMKDLNLWLRQQGVDRIFAYNARFDCRHLPELSGFSWFDIMRLAAYRQYNPRIPCTAPCCSTGRLKSRYGVEPILGLLSGDPSYRETHNAYYDAVDELRIMQLLGRSLCDYECGRING